MADGCPPDPVLDDFAAGRLKPDERDAVGSHVGTCSKCGAKLGHVVAIVGNKAPTQFDSPAAARRRVTAPMVPRQATPSPGDHSLTDTVISGEKSDPYLPAAAAGYARGSTLSRYVVIDQLGRGGMGEVYSAYDPDLDRKLAVKLLRSDFTGTGAADELRVRLLREAQAMARVSHPNVVTVHDVGLVGSQVFIAMEYLEGVTVADWLSAKKRTWSQVLDVFLQAGRGLAAAHASGLTHRDFKPENVVINPQGRVRVMDFGLVHAHDETAKKDVPVVASVGVVSESGAMKRRITQPGTLLGTPAYMSLEQMQGGATDPRSDQFSFCVALYEALYGERPFAGETAPAIAIEIAQNRVRAAPRDSLVPGRIRKLLLRGLRADPVERFRSMEALLIGLSRRRAAVIRQWIAMGAALVVAITAAAAIATTHRTAARCAAIAHRFDGVWDEQTRAASERAFLATEKPWAAHAWQEASRRLDTFKNTWVAERTGVCSAHAAVDEELGEQLLCLSRAYADAAAVARLFPTADADVVERAVPMVLTLPRVEACRAAVASTASAPAEPDEVLEGFGEARALLEAGRVKPAIEKAQALIEAHHADRAIVARGELLKAQAYARLGSLDEADRALLTAILNAEASHADDVAARAWAERVGVAGLRKPAEAEGFVKYAHAAIERAHSNPEVLATLTNNEGVVAYAQGRHAEAADAYFKAFELRRAALGQRHPLVARSLSNLGAALKAGGKPQEAVERYKQALSIEEQTLDPTHPAVAETLNNLGNALNEAGDSAAALAALRRSLSIKQQAYGTESLNAGVSMTNLGAVLLASGQLDEAEKVLRQSLSIKENASGKDTLTVAVTLTNLATVERQRQHGVEALAMARRALEIRRTRQGADHPDLAFNLTQEGQLLIDQKQPAQALVPLERAHLLRATQTANPRLLAETDFALARALAESKGDLKRARSLAESAASSLPETNPAKKQALDFANALGKKRGR